MIVARRASSRGSSGARERSERPWVFKGSSLATLGSKKGGNRAQEATTELGQRIGLRGRGQAHRRGVRSLLAGVQGGDLASWEGAPPNSRTGGPQHGVRSYVGRPQALALPGQHRALRH